jgi:ubiquinone/menaquinone biosynthesis C-methylase UbiE
MAEIGFEDGAAYERAMGRSSRAVAPLFIEWVAPPAGARWLDVGCGTGAFTELVLDTCSPLTVSAVDPAAAQIDHARRQPAAERANFRVANALALPFPDAVFDVVASALVINFIPDRPKALSEMRRVTRPRGIVAGYVWDFAAELSPSGPLRRGMQRIGVEVPQIPGTEHSDLEALAAVFARAGLERIATRTIEVTLRYSHFDDFWEAQTPAYLPTTKVIAGMTEDASARLREAVRAGLPVGPDGKIEYPARANAIKSHVPG